MPDPASTSRVLPWTAAIAWALAASFAQACGAKVETRGAGEAADTGGAAGTPAAGGGNGGAPGTGGLDMGGAGGAAGSGGVCVPPPSPCPEPSAECCEALDLEACAIPFDECRVVEYKQFLYANDTCEEGPWVERCFRADPDLFYPNQPEQDPCLPTFTATGTGVGVFAGMYRDLPDGTQEAGWFEYFICGLYGWNSCSDGTDAEACQCASTLGGACDRGPNP